nr:hypothetical protein [Tanacetum cinerariifolium]
MAGYKMEHFRGMTYEKVRPIFEREYKKVQTLFKPDKDVEEPKKKRVAKETLLQESFKKLKVVEVLGFEFKVEALQVKYPIIDWEIRIEDTLKGFDREDLLALWNLVKEKFSSVVPSVDKEKALWVELKILFKPDTNDVLWKLQSDQIWITILQPVCAVLNFKCSGAWWVYMAGCGVDEMDEWRRVDGDGSGGVDGGSGGGCGGDIEGGGGAWGRV